MTRPVASFVLVLVLGGGGSPASAQKDLISEPPPVTAPVERGDPGGVGPGATDRVSGRDPSQLEEWLVYLSDGAKRNRLMGGTTSLAASGLVMGVSIWAFLQSDPADELTRGAGMVGIAASGALMSLGIFQLAAKSQAENTLGRWRALGSDQPSAVEIARFEGELRQYTEAAKRSLRIGRWTQFGTALSGALILGVTPAADLSSDGETTGYVVGGVLLGAGLLGFGFSFIGQSKLDYWQAYLEGRRPPRSRWSVAPQAGRSFVGLRALGRF